MFDFTGYMLKIAEQIKAVQHIEGAKECKFFRISSVMNIEEMIERFNNAGSPCIMVEDNRTGRIMDMNSDNYLDIQSYSFLVMKHCKLMESADRESAKNATLQIVKTILSRMKSEKRAELKGEIYNIGLRNFDLNSVVYQTIGPIGENYYGTLVQFTMTSVLNPEIAFNSADWI